MVNDDAGHLHIFHDGFNNVQDIMLLVFCSKLVPSCLHKCTK